MDVQTHFQSTALAIPGVKIHLNKFKMKCLNKLRKEKYCHPSDFDFKMKKIDSV